MKLSARHCVRRGGLSGIVAPIPPDLPAPLSRLYPLAVVFPFSRDAEFCATEVTAVAARAAMMILNQTRE